MTARRVAQGEESFEQSLEKLETIVERLERGDVPLEESLKLYEEGVALSRRCAEKLQQVELVLKKLERDAGGTLTLLDDESDDE